MESAIGANPEGAIELGLLADDLGDLEAKLHRDVEAVRSDIDRVYDVTKWTVGAIVVALITLTVSTALDRLKRSPTPTS